MHWKELKSAPNSSLLLKPSLHLELLVSKFNNATAENHIDPENILLLNIMIC